MAEKELRAVPLPIDAGNVKYMLPLRIADQMNVLAFWAMNDRQDTKQRYIAQVWTGLQKCKEYLGEPTVVLGDFNWNMIWDASMSGPLYGRMQDVVELLDGHGITSVYHKLNTLEYGQERSHTLFMYRKPDRPYHVDYAFLSSTLMKSVTSFEVGKFAEWGSMSDHMPLFVDIQSALAE